MQSGNVRLKFSSIQEFAVLLFSKEDIRGCWFKKRSGRFVLKKYAVLKMDGTLLPEGLKKIRKELGFGRECITFLSGSLHEDGVFFRTSMPNVPVKAMREAILFEMPRMMLRNPENDLIQFTPAGNYQDESEMQVNVYSFPQAGLDSLTAAISQSLKKTDYFLYPLLPLRLTDGPVYLPQIEPDFFFADGQWHDKSKWDDKYYDSWENGFRERFELPDVPDFKIRDFTGCLLIARFVSAADFPKRSTGIGILPSKFRPGRLKNQLRFTVILILILLGGLLWEHGGRFYRESRELTNLKNQRGQLDRQLRQTKQRLKAAEKSQKELQKVLNQKPGETEILEKLAAFSKQLPSNVMVQNLRWTDSTLDLTLRSEAENLNIPAIIRPLKCWKITQMQERRRNNESASTITLKLTSVKEEQP